ncbi:GNAT family N-acetyltransferase [Dactylosporangium sp. NPDC048998]|uniref:GNAT family N-acetyltransferase n=1 Tax=Dactylosporangium sp. NPDC048998 TaxID=3363976 RepID=UPI00371E494E
MRLRPYGEDDRWLTAALEGDPDVMRYLGGPAPLGRVQQVHERRVGAAGGEWYRTILAGPDDAPAGVVAVFGTAWQGEQIPELGIMLLPGLRRRHGLAVGAIRLIVAEVRASGLVPRIHAFIGAANAAAAAVARRVGFVSAGPVDVDYEGVPIRCEHWLLDLGASPAELAG